LGHKDFATTQKYYARIEAGMAGKQLRDALNPPSMVEGYERKIKPDGIVSQTINAINPVIRGKFPPPGYG